MKRPLKNRIEYACVYDWDDRPGSGAVQRRRRWSAEEKAAIVQETYAPGGVGVALFRFEILLLRTSS
jgi:hypothetical protein